MDREILGEALKAHPQMPALLYELCHRASLGVVNVSALQVWLRNTSRSLTVSMEPQKQLFRWQRLFERTFIECSVDTLAYPENQCNLDRIVVVPSGLSIERLLDTIQKFFPVWDITDGKLGEYIGLNDRSNECGPYVIRASNECNCQDIPSQRVGVPITLMERLLLELIVFFESGRHLDTYGWTICAGTRGKNGFCFRVCWVNGFLRIDYHPYEDEKPEYGAHVRHILQ